MGTAPVFGQDAWLIPRRLAYIVDHAWPYSTSLDALRTHLRARALVQAGQDVIVFSRPGWPWDTRLFDSAEQVELEHMLDHVRYLCLPMPAMPGASGPAQLRQLARTFSEAFAVFRPAAVFAAASWDVAVAAQRAAVTAGSAYFCEYRMPSSDLVGDNAARVRQEFDLALSARAVFTPTEMLRQSLIAHGVPDGRVHVLADGVDVPQRHNRAISLQALGISARYVVGQVCAEASLDMGHFLHDLVAQLRQTGKHDVAGLIIVARDAPRQSDQAELRQQIETWGRGDFVRMVELSDLRELDDYLALCDVCLLPRPFGHALSLVPYLAASHSLPVVVAQSELATPLPNLVPVADTPEAWCAAVLSLLHPARATTVAHPADLTWHARLRPLLNALGPIAQAQKEQVQRIWAAAPAAPRQAHEIVRAQAFDMSVLPSVGLQDSLTLGLELRIGPKSPNLVADRVIWATRANLLDLLATLAPGRFVIDWAGMQAHPEPAEDEWALLWSAHDMRLNRQIRDAVRIGLARGWRVQVIGPVHRGDAPLYRSVSDVVEEVGADQRQAGLGGARA